MQPLYKIKLQNFEGPLDLLLFFVRKDELNIYDIPLARITKSYLEYLQLMQDLDLDIAGEFILMAATLMRIKAASMLPPDPSAEDDEDMMDPREELSRRLIEYRQFKEASKTLSELDEYWRTVYRRTYFNFDLLPPNLDEAVGLKDVSFFDLLTAYKNALAKRPKMIFHNIERIQVTVEDQRKYIMDFFRDRTCYLFTELCEDMGKIEIVVTFLAMLELIRQGEIAAKQASIFDDIWIYKAAEFEGDEIPEADRAVDAIYTGISNMAEPGAESESPIGTEVVPMAGADPRYTADEAPPVTDDERDRNETEATETAAHHDDTFAEDERLKDEAREKSVETETAAISDTVVEAKAMALGVTDAAVTNAEDRGAAENTDEETTKPGTETPIPMPITGDKKVSSGVTGPRFDLPVKEEKKSEDLDSREKDRLPVVSAVARPGGSVRRETVKISIIRGFLNRIVSLVKKLFS